MEREDEKLPECNPVQVCPICHGEYPIWRLRLYIGEEKPRLAHNFCPSSEASPGRIVEICMQCKTKEVVEYWRKGRK